MPVYHLYPACVCVCCYVLYEEQKEHECISLQVSFRVAYMCVVMTVYHLDPTCMCVVVVYIYTGKEQPSFCKFPSWPTYMWHRDPTCMCVVMPVYHLDYTCICNLDYTCMCVLLCFI